MKGPVSSARRHLLFAINGLGTGGSERSMVELIPHLRSAGLEPSFACLYRRNEGVQKAVERAGMPIHFLASGNPLSRARELRRLLRSGGGGGGAAPIDLLHTVHFEADLGGRLASAGLGLPVISSLVGTPYAPARLADPNIRSRRLDLVRRVDGWTARRWVSRFHAVGETVKAEAVAALGIAPERVTVIRRGRDPERLGEPGAERRLRVRRALGLDEEAEVVVNVGRQEYQKGQLDLLVAAARLLARRPRAVVLIAGRQGNASRELAGRASELGLGEPRLRFLGHRDDVPDLLAAADLFAFPSLYEGLPGAVIEAIALGVPVVASDIPQVREILGDEGGEETGLLVPPRSPGALATALEELLADPGRRQALGVRGREIFFRDFTLERYAGQMIELYQRALGD